MTPEEKDALNRCVAKALGWRWFLATVISEDSGHRGQQHPLFMSPQDVAEEREKDYYDLQPCEKPEVVEAWRWGDVPDFCTDPSAADSLLGKMLENGWGVREEYEPQDTPLRGGSIARTSIYMSKSTTPEIVRAFPLSDAPRYTARCYAFLAAHDAQEGQK